MTSDELIAIVDAAGVQYVLGTQQDQYNQVRFFFDQTNRSFNLGYRSQQGPFVADFVFKGESKEVNDAKCEAFLRLFGGERGNRSTAFARLQPHFSETEWLVRVIQGYWAISQPRGA